MKTAKRTAKAAGKTATRAFTRKAEGAVARAARIARGEMGKPSARPMKNICVCGCGLPCHKLFKQGHDQRARSMYLAGTATPSLKEAIKKGLLVPKMDAYANAPIKINQKPSKLVKKQTRRAA
jgi:hypothetical protein